MTDATTPNPEFFEQKLETLTAKLDDRQPTVTPRQQNAASRRSSSLKSLTPSRTCS